MESFFTPEYVKHLQPYIQKTVDDLLAALKKKGSANEPVDLVNEFALPVPSYVSSRPLPAVPDTLLPSF